MVIGIVHFLALLPIAMSFSVGLVLCAGLDAGTVDSHDVRPFDWQTNPPSPDAGIDFNILESYLAGQSNPTVSEFGATPSNTASSSSEAVRSGHTLSRSRRRSRMSSSPFLNAFKSTAPELYDEYLDSKDINKWPNGRQTEQLKKQGVRPYKAIIKTLEENHPEVFQLMRNEEEAKNQREREKPDSCKSLVQKKIAGTITPAGVAKLKAQRARDVQNNRASRQRKKKPLDNRDHSMFEHPLISLV